MLILNGFWDFIKVQERIIMHYRGTNSILNPTEVSLLGMIEKRGPVSLNSLAHSCFSSPESLRPHINNLMHRDFIVEEHAPNNESLFRLKW